MDSQRIEQSMITCAEGYSTLIFNSINVAISLDMDNDILISIIQEWIDIRKNIVIELQDWRLYIWSVGYTMALLFGSNR